MSDRAPAGASDIELASCIARGASQLKCALEAEQVERLVAYLRLIQRWNSTYNLTAIRDPADMAVQHILDCLSAVPPLRRHRATSGLRRIIDVGSGAGLPGLLFALALSNTEVVCVDSVGKKTAFITQALGVLGLRNATAVHARVEAFKGLPFDVITSRAFGSLSDLTRGTKHLLADNGEWMAMKGKPPADEIATLGSLQVEVQPLRVPGLEAERCLVWIRPDPT